ncbi:protein FAM83H-like [Sphaeramia orbicularis]|uniref:Protein FAM83H-like n=1 Tax=Sphaeramia orbicularis TaxID=375764 RepID=A0A672ZWL0_9TELE|nr:protein FAM83H-like [Sphaeramia orbicularis]
MARRSQCSSAGENPLDPNYLPPHYREEYRLAIDALVEEDLEGYYKFLQIADVVDFLSTPEIEYIHRSIQLPKQSAHPEHHYLDTGGGDGSSDTYWPLHSDVDAPGLDLGWPQVHHFIGPTEVTSLVNPPAPDMPSIKEQARRLIKNAQMVVAIVMDMFTDVDIFADILNAAMRNVAVYILLDEQNVQYFVNMVNNCRVNLQSVQSLRVRTVSGITYHCRSGKSFKGQMLDRFLLTDCRAVLSGNYSFMWSFEKVHRCMAHLFFGQLVSTFDEEFRILFAQSQPLIIENMEDLSHLQKRQYPTERPSLYRDYSKFRSLDIPQSEDWPRHSYEEHSEVDWRMAPLKRHESLHGPGDMYGRFPSQQARMDPSFDQGPSRIPLMDNPAYKRHSYAEGGPGRYPYAFPPQQGLPDIEAQGRLFHRGQQPHPGPGLGPGPGPGPGLEGDYSGYDKFWNPEYLAGEQYPEPGLPQDMEPPDNFDPVLNYLSSTRNLDIDQGSEKLLPVPDFGSSQPRRLSAGHPYVCQTSPTPSNPTDQKQFYQEPNMERKDPMVKRGLRNWRISSYLSAFDNPEDEGLPNAPPQASDPFEETSNPIQPTVQPELPMTKIPNVREFKVPALPRPSQIPSYVKMQVPVKKMLDESAPVVAETKTTPSPSESSSTTTDGDKVEEMEQKEPKTSVLRREESFRRKYNAAVQRSSRLRSSLIFSSLDQQSSQDTKAEDEDGNKNETEQTKLPFATQVFSQRRSAAREPFEWSRYIKSATIDNSETSKGEDKNSKTDRTDTDSTQDKEPDELPENQAAQEPQKPVDIEGSSPLLPRPQPTGAELPKILQLFQPSKSLLSHPIQLDMNDPDQRLLFFKELAAKRRATEAEKKTEMAPTKPVTDVKTITAVEKEEPASEEASPKEVAEKPNASSEETVGEKATITEDSRKIESTETSDRSKNKDSLVEKDPKSLQSCEKETVSTDSEKMELKKSQSAAVSPEIKPPQEPNLSDSAVIESSASPSPTTTPAADVAVDGESETPNLDSTSEDPKLPHVEVSVSSPVATSGSSSVPQNTESGFSFSQVQSSTSDYVLPHTGSQESPSSSPGSVSVPLEPISTEETCITPPTSEKTEQSVIHTVDESVQKSTSLTKESTQELTEASEDSVPQSTSSETPLEADTEPNTSSQPSTISSDEPRTLTLGSDKDSPGSETSSVTKEAEVSTNIMLTSPEDIKPDRAPTPPFSSEVSDLDGSTCKSAQSPPEHLPHDAEQSIEEVVRRPPRELEITEEPEFEKASHESPTTPSEGRLENGATVVETPECLLTGTSSPVTSDEKSDSETRTFTEDILPGAASGSPLSESVMAPEAEKTETDMSASVNLSETDSTDANKESSLTLKEPTSTAPSEPSVPEETPEPAPRESTTTEPSVPAENGKMDDQSEDSKDLEDTEALTDPSNDQEKQNSSSEPSQTKSDDSVPPPSSQSKQQKPAQSRYHSSTANVLSSSNLRDDTKILLEQISANSQSRNESATKEAPVTDDEKEDEADKNAKRQKGSGFRSQSGGQPKSSQERDKLLERIQSMRKDRKVYSRFEV